MKRYVIAWLIILLPLLSHSQGENNIWLVNDFSTLNFNVSPPGLIYLPEDGGGPPYFKYTLAAAACDASGNLRFWVKMHGQYNKVFNAAGEGICNLTYDYFGNRGGENDPIIVPHPGNADQYYIFYSYSEGILYTLIDMSMNGGAGGVVPGQHDKILCAFNSIVTDRFTSIIGCDGIWIVARSSLAKEFYSWHITASGLDTTKVTSVCGSLDLYWMADTQLEGVLKGSPNGNRLTLTGHNGVELYDFEKCSGKVKNAKLIDRSLDTLWVISPGDTAVSSVFYGACFSPDESRLYVTENFTKRAWSPYAAGTTQGEVYQYNVELETAEDINMSKTLIIHNPITITPHVFYGCVMETIRHFGDIKQGPDKKLYLSNNAWLTCLPDPPPEYNNFPAYHIIEQPNELGLACIPLLNALPTAIEGGLVGAYLPNDILIAPNPPDTLSGTFFKVLACFKDTVALKGSDEALCQTWDNGLKVKERKVYRNGRYLFHYSNDVCEYRTDTFDIEIVRPPLVIDIKAACPKMKNGSVSFVNGYMDTTTLRYDFMDSESNVLYTSISNTGCSFNGLDTGINYVRISTVGGCDTIYTINVPALPMPHASFTCDTLACVGEAVQFVNSSDAPATWYFDWNIMITEQNPEYIFPLAGEYDIWLVAQNEEGCTDTAYGKVRIEALELQLRATSEIAERGEQVWLVSSANEDFTVLSWLPEIFTDPFAKSQIIKVDTSQWITVSAQSDKLGCIDSASVRIEVEPTLLIPDAFSPNGDGVNDIFRPVSSKDIIINSFTVFDRWGKPVYEGSGKSIGWDGTDKGRPANAGTYHYLLQYVSLKGKPVVLKGTITLVR